jgi:pyruvate dehydrogenase E1 component alpha subunit
LRKAPVVTIAYCGDDVVEEADFLEGIRFSAHHALPIILICEHSCLSTSASKDSCLAKYTLPDTFTHFVTEGNDVLSVYETMQQAIQHTRMGKGPVLLEVFVSPTVFPQEHGDEDRQDPLVFCKHLLQTQGAWDEVWATQLQTRLLTEVEQALRDARRDTQR